MWAFTRLLTIPNRIGIVFATKWWHVARRERCLEEVSHSMFANRLISSTQMLMRRNYCGRVQSVVSCCWAARACHYRWTQTLSQRPTTFALPSRPISAWTNTFPLQHMCIMFLLAAPTSTGSTITGRRVREDTCPRFCDSSSWLLQRGTHRGPWPTNYNGCWTLPRVSSAARTSTTTVNCHRFYMPTCTCSMWLIGSGTSLCYSPPMCLHNKAPQYLVDCCVPVWDITSRQRL